MFQLTAAEAQALANDGGEVVEIIQGERVVIAFQNTNKMLALISAVKSFPELRNVTTNSKRVDGVDHLTISRK